MSSKNKIIQAIESAQLKTDIPAFGAGDTVVVQVKVKEGTRERLKENEVFFNQKLSRVIKKDLN